MSYTPIGLPVAREVLEAMRLATARFWHEWQAYYDRASPDRKEELQKELQEILESYRAGSTTETDDHLVRARNADTTTVGGLMEKTGPSDTITPELYTDPITGTERVRFNAAAPTPTPGEGSWLYTGSIQETNLLDPVKAFVKSLQGMGGLDPGQAELWDVLESGDYQHKAVGQLYGLAPDGTETFALSLGQRVWLTVWTESGGTYRGGLFTISTLGDGSTKAVLHPVASPALAVGDMFTVEGVGAEFEGWYWEVLSLPDMAIAYRPEYANETTHNLFTSTQVSQAGSVTRETEVTIPGGTSGGTMFVIPYFEMLDVLGVSTIPKGVVNWEIKAYVVADDPAATVFIRAHLTTDQGVLDRFGYGDTPPIHNTSAAVLKMQGTIAADRTVDPAAKLGAVFYGYSNSASAVTIKLVFNDAGHSTRVQTPLTTASFGTLDHQLLTPSSRGFAAGEEANAHTYRHPMASIEPGLITWDDGATVATVDGLLTLPPKTNSVRISGTDTLLGIATTGMTAGTVIYVTMSQGRPVANGGDVPTGYASPIFHTAMGFTASPSTFLAPGEAAMVLELSGSSTWRVLSAPWVEPQRKLWPAAAGVTINTTTAPGLLVLPAGCPGTIYVTGTALRAITVEDAEGNAQAGPLAGLKLYFLDACTLYHDDPLSGWDAGLAARAAKLDLLPPEGATGEDLNRSVKAKNTMRFLLDSFGDDPLWILEVGQ